MRHVCLEALLAVLCLGCSTPPQLSSPPPVQRLATTSAPVHWLVQTLMPGQSLPVELLLPSGEDAATWRPSTDQLLALQQGALVVTNGAGFEPWVTTSTLPLGNRLDTTQAVALVERPPVHHSHGGEAPHEHRGPDPHTWLDPQRYAQQASAIADTLVSLLPDRADAVRTAQQALQADLAQLDAELTAALACLKGHRIAANHPTWTYWEAKTGLSVTVLPLEPGTPGDSSVLSQTEAWARGAKDPIVLWEAEPGEALREAFPGAQHLVLDPLEGAPEGGTYDYRAQAQVNVDRLADLCNQTQDTPAP